MDVNNINSAASGVNNYAPPPPVNEQTNPVNETAPVVNETEKPKDDAAVFEPGDNDKKVYKPDAEKIKQMWSQHDQKVESFRRLVEGLLNKQAQKFDLARDDWGRPVWTGSEMIEIDDETRAAAQAEIGEGGYYSVEETAKRLLDFAVALSGGDPAKIETLKDGFEKGFKQAEEMWGGKLPQISYDTYDAVMKGFDEWKQVGDAGAISLLKPKDAA